MSGTNCGNFNLRLEIGQMLLLELVPRQRLTFGLGPFKFVEFARFELSRGIVQSNRHLTWTRRGRLFDVRFALGS